jgi:hypothetical protein
VRRNYSSPGRIGSTSTTPCIKTTRLAATPALPHLHRVFGRMVSPLGLLSGRTGSCALSTHLPAARALRQHHSAPQLLASGLSDLNTCCLVALTLLHLCCASERAVSALDFSSVGRTGSRRAPGHCVSPLDLFSNRIGSTSSMLCTMTTCLTETPTLPRLCRASPRLRLVATSALHRLHCAPPRRHLLAASHRLLILASFPN